MAVEHADQQLYTAARAQFAYFDTPREAFMENAGGSQVPNVVIDAIADYMRTRLATRPPLVIRLIDTHTREQGQPCGAKAFCVSVPHPTAMRRVVFRRSCFTFCAAIYAYACARGNRSLLCLL